MIKIFFIGFMGSGKSFVGQRVAKAMNLPFYDLDAYIEGKEKKTISEIFEEQGETGFRRLEQKYLLEFESIPNAVIACGGGTPCFFDNMKWMNEHGISIYLQTPVPLLFKRLRHETNQRPLIANKGEEALLNFITEKLEDRSPFYKQASIIYHCHTEEDDVVGEILSHLSYTNWRLETEG